MKLTRREILLGSVAGLGALTAGRFLPAALTSPIITGGIVGANASLGHKLRSGGFPTITSTISHDVVIIGGGIAGLAAAYQLNKQGITDFMLLDAEKSAGGNAQSGKNEVSSYSWGAHYVPLLTEEATEVRALFEEFGIIKGRDANGLFIYNEDYICADPDERLYHYGRWQDGLIPTLGITPEEDAQYKKFFAFTESLKHRKGSDGKRLFAIPVDRSSHESAWRELDNITMYTWMMKEGYTSKPLHWYVDYCCRDDYGTSYKDASAWAGLHYFAARNGVAANTASDNVITWSEGNGWLVHKLKTVFEQKIKTQALAFYVAEHEGRVLVDYYDAVSGAAHRLNAKTVIMATPHFISARLMGRETSPDFTYAPWAVVNITLDAMPQGKGAALAWDNVAYGSTMLGYVVATHQVPQMRPTKTVITYYWPLSHLAPQDARKEAYARSYEDWQRIVLKELLQIHPELVGQVKHLDVWLWGHAMIRPTVGFIWGKARSDALQQTPPIFTAHSDMSGISIFEEAYTHGVRAAEGVMYYLEKQKT